MSCLSASFNIFSVFNSWPFPGSSTTWSTPLYSGRSRLYFSLTEGGTNLMRTTHFDQCIWINDLAATRRLKATTGESGIEFHGSHLPPRKCLPSKYFTSGFGAVKLTRFAGWNWEPVPDLGGPSSMFHDEGASTDVTGMDVFSSAEMTDGKGSRTSPEKLKPFRKNTFQMASHGGDEWTDEETKTHQRWRRRHDGCFSSPIRNLQWMGRRDSWAV